MSYILEALKRADAERQRGAVPGLLASQVTTAPASVPSDGRRRAVWIAVAVLALGGLAVGLWRSRMPAPVPVPVPQVQTEAPPPSVPVLAAGLPNAVVAASAQPSVALPSPSTTTPTVAAAPAVAASMPVAALPKPVARAAPASATTPPVPAAEPTAVAVAVAPVPHQASGPQAAAAGVALLGELPEELRRQIPALSINGVVYSANPAQRLLVVNNQVLTQGSLAAPELRLEEIESKSSVFSFRGTRFRVTH